MWNTKIFVATETDGFDVTNLVMVMEVNPMLVKDKSDFKRAVMAACKEYCLTEEGKKVYERNLNNFNWGEFDTYVPNDICEKYGIRKVQSNVSGEFIFDQQLVSEDEIFPEIEQVRATNIMWNVDEDEDGSELPTTVIIPDEYILGSEYDKDSLSEAVSDWLSDEYGFCHEGFELVYLTSIDLKEEEEKLKRSVNDAGVDAVEEFLGHALDDNTIDIWSEMNDCLSQMPDEEYLKYLAKYCN